MKSCYITWIERNVEIYYNLVFRWLMTEGQEQETISISITKLELPIGLIV